MIYATWALVAAVLALAAVIAVSVWVWAHTSQLDGPVDVELDPSWNWPVLDEEPDDQKGE